MDPRFVDRNSVYWVRYSHALRTKTPLVGAESLGRLTARLTRRPIAPRRRLPNSLPGRKPGEARESVPKSFRHGGRERPHGWLRRGRFILAANNRVRELPVGQHSEAKRRRVEVASCPRSTCLFGSRGGLVRQYWVKIEFESSFSGTSYFSADRLKLGGVQIVLEIRINPES
jgi:hypothetical protein